MSTSNALRPDDEIRIIAPSSSWRPARQKQYELAIEHLEAVGYKITLSKNIRQTGRFGTAPLQARLDDFHQAYRDSAVKAILCLGGGWSANELLPCIDWKLIVANPKPLIGFSDITVLHNAVYATTGHVGLLGPNLGSLGSLSHLEYSLANLQRVLSKHIDAPLTRSHGWESGNKAYKSTRPWTVLQAGSAEGTLIGGNIGTYYLLQGTPYAPSFTGDIVLAIEDDDEAGKFTAREFDRRLESILQQPGALTSIKAVLVGRFQPSSGVTMPDVKDIIGRKIPAGIPVVANMDFGHTKPLLTLPIGGKVSVDANARRPIIKLIEY